MCFTQPSSFAYLHCLCHGHVFFFLDLEWIIYWIWILNLEFSDEPGLAWPGLFLFIVSGFGSRTLANCYSAASTEPLSSLYSATTTSAENYLNLTSILWPPSPLLYTPSVPPLPYSSSSHPASFTLQYESHPF